MLVPWALQLRPLTCAVAQHDPLGSRGDHLAQQLDACAVQGCGPRPCGTVAHTPRQGQGAPLLDHVEHQRPAPTADDTALPAHHQPLAGARRQEEGRRRYKVPLCPEARVIEPSGTAFAAALGLGPIGACVAM
jgi:hypothetical protein